MTISTPALAAIATITAVTQILLMGASELPIDPKTAGEWTDRGTILALLGMETIVIGILLRRIINTGESQNKALLDVIERNSAAIAKMNNFLEAEKKFRDNVAHRAITDVIRPKPKVDPGSKI